MKSYSELTLDEQAEVCDGDILRCDLCVNWGAWKSDINPSTVTLPSDDDDSFSVCEVCETMRIKIMNKIRLITFG